MSDTIKQPNPAKVYELDPVRDEFQINGKKYAKFFFNFTVPRDHSQPGAGGEEYKLYAEILRPWETAPKSMLSGKAHPLRTFVYLVGGPGSAQELHRIRGLTEYVLANDFQLLLLDYRGCGKSEQITKDALDKAKRKNDGSHIKLITQARTPNIVRDFEAVRLRLRDLDGRDEDAAKFTLMGQSYGGWIAILYAQLFPHGVRDILLTAAMPPIFSNPLQVYKSLFRGVAKANEEFYELLEGNDKEIVRDVAKEILKLRLLETKDKRGNMISLTTFASMGRMLGKEDGPRKLLQALEEVKVLLRDPQPNLDEIFEKIDTHTFEKRVIYAIDHEMQCYDRKPDKSKYFLWSASRVRKQAEYSDHYRWLDAEDPKDLDDLWDHGKKFYFLGEGFMPEHAEDYAVLRELKADELVHELATIEDPPYEEMWNEKKLRENKVPIFAIIYDRDLYVSADLSIKAADVIGMVKPKVLKDNDTAYKGLRHESVRESPQKVMEVFRGMGYDGFKKTPKSFESSPGK